MLCNDDSEEFLPGDTEWVTQDARVARGRRVHRLNHVDGNRWMEGGEKRDVRIVRAVGRDAYEDTQVQEPVVKGGRAAEDAGRTSGTERDSDPWRAREFRSLP